MCTSLCVNTGVSLLSHSLPAAPVSAHHFYSIHPVFMVLLWVNSWVNIITVSFTFGPTMYILYIYIYKVRGERVNGSHSLTITALPYVGNWKPVMVGILCLACYCNCLIFCWCVALFMLMHCSAVV